MKVQLLIVLVLLVSCSKSDIPETKPVSRTLEKPAYPFIGILSFKEHGDDRNSSNVIRIGFAKKEVWEVIGNVDLPEELSWSLTLSGKSLGAIRSKATTSRYYGHADAHAIVTPLEQINKIENSSNLFSTWTGYDRFTPQVVTSRGTINDPQAWKSVKTKTIVDAAKREFIKGVPEIPLCKDGTLEVIRQIKVTYKNLSLIKAFASNRGEYLVGIKLPNYWEISKCDGIPPKNFFSHWYYVKNKAAKLLGIEIVPVDAGDYDGDGRSEWIFQISRYNEDGYGLLSMESLKMIEFTWKYH